jgi:hypothetical protein
MMQSTNIIRLAEVETTLTLEDVTQLGQFDESSMISSELMQVCFSRTFIESSLGFLAEDIIVDDVTLIKEGYLDNGCATLTGMK